jgi:TRAP-type C4-dicarboxylate transport system permease small subunit
MMRLVAFLDRNIEKVFIVVLTIILVSGLTYSAFVRYFVALPAFTRFTFVAEELSLFSFIGLLYFGAALAARDGSHFRVSAQFEWLPPRWYPWRFAVADVIWILFNLFAVWQGAVLVKSAIDRPEHSLALELPMWLPYLIIPLTFLLTSFRVIQRYLRGEHRVGQAYDPREAHGE